MIIFRFKKEVICTQGLTWMNLVDIMLLEIKKWLQEEIYYKVHRLPD
jgi:hypothetical protein